MTTETRTIVLASRPQGEPTLTNFAFEVRPIPELKEGQVKTQTLYLSVDPYMRGRMNAAKSYAASFELGQPIYGGGASRVLESKSTRFNVGDVVFGITKWAEYNVLDEKGLLKQDPRLSIENSMSVLGITGFTAYFGLLDIGNVKSGETILITGAAGATGIIAGQVAKILGLTVVGVAGTPDKCELLKELGFDVVINYKTTPNLSEAFAAAAPKGYDVFFDNVGGSQFDAALPLMKDYGRVIHCGAIANYNVHPAPTGPRVEGPIITKRLRLQGFIISDYAPRFSEAIPKLVQWLSEGKIKAKATVVHGFENTPKAFLDLFTGQNTGKMLVQVAK